MIQGVEGKASVDDEICTLDILLTDDLVRFYIEQRRHQPLMPQCLDRPEISTLQGSILNLGKLLESRQNRKMTAT
jgi:hypothetical protein